jgi:Holliday junction resolvase RusA-like endonuclease
VLNRPTKGRKVAVEDARRREIPEHRRLKRFLENGFEREKITKRPAEFDGSFLVYITHYRHRKIDIDNLSNKAIIDSLEIIGLIPDDGPKHLNSLRVDQEKLPKTDPERVEIRILEIPASGFSF